MTDKHIITIPGILDGNWINRLEVLDSSGRAYVKLDLQGLELLIQDDGKALKILAKDRGVTS